MTSNSSANGVVHTHRGFALVRESGVVTPLRGHGEVTVVLSDEQPMIRNGLRALFSDIQGITVVAEATTGQEAVRQALLHRPTVLILDMDFGGREGAATIRKVLQSAPRIAVLVFTSFDDDESVLGAVQAGARGYLLKSAEKETIVRAVRGLAAGEAIFGPRIAGRLPELFSSRTAGTQQLLPELTERERQVLDLIATGIRNSAIAYQLHLSPKTISNHISTIFSKLRVTGRAEAIVLARNAGLGGAQVPRRGIELVGDRSQTGPLLA